MGVTPGIYGATGASGWTSFTPSGTPQYGYNTGRPPPGNTMVIYVSSSTGKDPGDGGFVAVTQGSSATPYRTIAQGLLYLRIGQPDWCLLKKGDKWVEFNQISNSGLSATEPSVISAYDPANPTVVNPATGGARPLINVATGPAQPGLSTTGSVPGSGDFLAIVGIELYAYDRDPASPNYNPATVDSGLAGMAFLQTFSWMLIEDCKVSFFNGNNIQGFNSPSFNLTIRRNIIVDQYCNLTFLLSTGMFISKIQSGFVLEENLFDHNGWNATVPNADPNVFCHNIYTAGFVPREADGYPVNSGTLSPTAARGNIFSNDAAGCQFRSGGTFDNNLSLANPYAPNIGAPTLGVHTVTNSIFLEGVNNSTANSWGPGTMTTPYEGDNYNIGTVLFSGNIVAHTKNVTGAAQSIYCTVGFETNVTITGNIITDWNTLPLSIFQDIYATDTVHSNYTKNFGSGTWNVNSTSLGAPPGMIDENRTIETYDASIGGPGTQADFLAGAKALSKSNWNPNYTANNVNIYIRAGFGIGIVIVLSPGVLPNGSTTTPYSQTITASGGTAPYTFAVSSGTLPTGLSLSSGGILSGTPTVPNTFTFSIQATDHASVVGTIPYMVTITPVSSPNVTIPLRLFFHA